VSAVIERRNARTAGRSALAQSCEMVDCHAHSGRITRERGQIQRYREERNRWFPIFSGAMRGAGTGDNAVRENGNGELFEVVGEAISRPSR